MCAYLSKIEDECSHATSKTFKEAAEGNCSNYEQLFVPNHPRDNTMWKRPHTTLCQNYGFEKNLQ